MDGSFTDHTILPDPTSCTVPDSEKTELTLTLAAGVVDISINGAAADSTASVTAVVADLMLLLSTTERVITEEEFAEISDEFPDKIA